MLAFLSCAMILELYFVTFTFSLSLILRTFKVFDICILLLRVLFVLVMAEQVMTEQVFFEVYSCWDIYFQGDI